MRTLVDLEDKTIRELDEVARKEKSSRAAVIRKAVAAFLLRKRPEIDEAFGSWGERKTDGLDYQRKIRAEW